MKPGNEAGNEAMLVHVLKVYFSLAVASFSVQRDACDSLSSFKQEIS